MSVAPVRCLRLQPRPGDSHRSAVSASGHLALPDQFVNHGFRQPQKSRRLDWSGEPARGVSCRHCYGIFKISISNWWYIAYGLWTESIQSVIYDLSMPRLDDPAIDELRDTEGSFLGRAPVQGWLKPIQVSLRIPTFRDLFEAKRPIDASGPTELGFVVHTPWAAPKPPVGYVRPSRRVFDEFLALSHAPVAEIHKFASRFGPLMIYCRPEPSTDRATEIIHERSEVWRYFARCMRSLLRIAASFHSHRRPDSSDWDAIGNCPLPVYNARWRIKDADVLNPLAFQPEESWSAGVFFVGAGEQRDREMGARLLNCLLQLGRARPLITWEGSGKSARPQMVFSTPRLLSYLALQLCLTALESEAFEVCGYCCREYTGKRAPKAGQRNFCPECRRTGVPGLLAQREHRARVRGDRSEGRFL